MGALSTERENQKNHLELDHADTRLMTENPLGCPDTRIRASQDPLTIASIAYRGGVSTSALSSMASRTKIRSPALTEVGLVHSSGSTVCQ